MSETSVAHANEKDKNASKAGIWIQAALLYLEEQIDYHNIALGTQEDWFGGAASEDAANHLDDMIDYLTKENDSIQSGEKAGLMYAQLADAREAFMNDKTGDKIVDPIAIQIETIEIVAGLSNPAPATHVI